MTTHIPQGWQPVTLAAVAAPLSERVAPEHAADLPYIGLEHIEPGTMQLLGSSRASEVRSVSLAFARGDVLYGKMRPYLNKVWLAEFDGVCSPEFLVFRKTALLDAEFLAFRLHADDFVSYANALASGERPRVHFNQLGDFRLLLPPVAEQGRIVAQLKMEVAALRRASLASARAQARLVRLRAALLDDAVSGQLTQVWRAQQGHQLQPASVLLRQLLQQRRASWEEALASGTGGPAKRRYAEPVPHQTGNLPALPEHWIWASLDQIGELSRGRSRHRPRGDARLYGGPYPFIQTGDIRRSAGMISSHEQSYSEFGLAQSRLWPAGTLCITVAANIAESGILDYPACFPDSVVGFVQRPELLNLQFVEYFIRSRKADLERYAPATAQKNLNLEMLASLAIPLPPLEEQNEIVALVQQRLQAIEQLANKIEFQIARTHHARKILLQEAFSGHRTQPGATDVMTAAALLPVQKESLVLRKPLAVGGLLPKISPLKLAGHAAKTAAMTPERIRNAFRALKALRPVKSLVAARTEQSTEQTGGRFRLIQLWLKNFKNLRDYTASFSPTKGLDVVMGGNGTGKSNLFESLVIIFRDLHDWCARNRWPDVPLQAFRLTYEMDEKIITIIWDESKSKRPLASCEPVAKTFAARNPETMLERQAIPLPRFVFGYYSGPGNRLAEHFLPMNQAHYARLRDANSDDPATLVQLLEQRRFFCAETHHAKYVLLAFCYKRDAAITAFLRNRLRIDSFESALFIIRRPRWAKSGSTVQDFWGATGVMRRVLERLREFAAAPAKVEQTVNDGYRSVKEDHYYFLLPDLSRLHAFAAEYENARTFFLALESMDFSELIYDVRIQVRVNSSEHEQASITFKEMSEGEQQLLMVLGLMRFTKSVQSLILLDEPDTHLNSNWSTEYLQLLTDIMQDSSHQCDEQQTSQILISTHNPLVTEGLPEEQIHLMKRDQETGTYQWMDTYTRLAVCSPS